jgi:hypothetical protein
MADQDIEGQAPVSAAPGAVISPGSVPSAAPAPQAAQPQAPPTPQQVPNPVPFQQPESPQDQANEPQDQNSDSEIYWTASEYIAHEKSAGWYARLGGASLLLALIVLLLTKDKISAIVVLVVAFLFAIVASRQPRELQYGLDPGGVTVGQRYLPYEEFRSFSVVPEGAFLSIVFMPLKRFATITTIYFAPENEDRIVRLLTDRLPFEEHKHDLLEQLMRRIRF